jgi:hypothetical protein
MRLPDVDRLKRLMQSLALLDAIMSPEWDYRYYSFNSQWGPGEQMGSMRNGQGDDLFALFSDAGCFIKGFDHELTLWDVPANAFYAQLPRPFDEQAREVAFSPDHVTFCLWRAKEDEAWQQAVVAAYEEDGSEYLLELLDGDPDSYRDFAARYYEQDVDGAAIAAIYGHEPVTEAFARRINPDIDWNQLQEDAAEIGYKLDP